MHFLQKALFVADYNRCKGVLVSHISAENCKSHTEILNKTHRLKNRAFALWLYFYLKGLITAKIFEFKVKRIIKDRGLKWKKH